MLAKHETESNNFGAGLVKETKLLHDNENKRF